MSTDASKRSANAGPGCSSRHRLFPLHLAPIDSFFLMDDTVAYPMSSVIHFDFTGHLEPNAFHESLAIALGRHPLLSAVVQPAKRNQPCWVPYSGDRPSVAWSNEATGIPSLESEYIDLTREPGVRFWVNVGGGRSRMTVQVHHACTDGTGVYRFIGDLLADYGRRTSSSGSYPELQPLAPLLLRQRRRKMGKVALHGSSWECLRHVLAEAWNVFGKSVRPLSAPVSGSSENVSLAPFPGICSAELTAAEHQALRQVAARRGAMVNDLLLAQMFRSIAEWNTRHAAASSRGRLRVMMPFDMRDRHDYSMPAANMTAYTFVSRRLHECRNVETMIEAIRDETVRIKQGHHGTDFIDALMIADRVPQVLPRLLRLNRCMSTVALSNVGDPSKRFLSALPRDRGRIVSGNVTLEEISGVPPLRQMTRSSLAVFSYLRNSRFACAAIRIVFQCRQRATFYRCLSMVYGRSCPRVISVRAREKLSIHTPARLQHGRQRFRIGQTMIGADFDECRGREPAIPDQLLAVREGDH